MLIKIGLLFSQSGTTSIVERGQLKACLLAIEEINSRNSLIKLEPIVGDVKSDPQIAAMEAHRLFVDSGIDVLVGCYTSAVRKIVSPILYEKKGLLLYPTLYEGEEKHPNIFYCGAVPNQQVEPMLSWIINNISDKFVLVGSDYVYPRSTNQQIKGWVERARGTIICERYFTLGTEEFSKFFRELQKISKFTPSLVIFSTLVGTSILSFYKEYRKKQFSFPIASPITTEIENELMGKQAAAGHYCTSGYFQSIDTVSNNQFVSKFRNRFGKEPISREMASSYEAIHLLSEAYHTIRSTPHYRANVTQKLRRELKNLSFNGPQGKIIMDPDTQHLWQ
ncbi:transporter substrate-binding protein, partial [Thermodesulfobacteriota bacterium]